MGLGVVSEVSTIAITKNNTIYYSGGKHSLPDAVNMTDSIRTANHKMSRNMLPDVQFRKYTILQSYQVFIVKEVQPERGSILRLFIYFLKICQNFYTYFILSISKTIKTNNAKIVNVQCKYRS